MVFLSDDIITLRAVEPADLDLFYKWENDTALWDMAPTIAPFSRELLRAYIESYVADIYADKQLRLMVTLTASGITIGTVDITDFDPINRRAAIGILIDDAYRGHGYGLRAVNLACSYCEQRVGMHQLWASVAADNEPSLRLFTSAGFRRYGRLRSWIRRGRTYADAYTMQKLFSGDSH